MAGAPKGSTGFTPTQTDFTAGEIAEAISGRIDQKFYAKSLLRCRNMIPRVQGGIYRRMGTKDVGDVKVPNKQVVLCPFIPEVGEAYDIEFGHNVVRITKNSALVALEHPTDPLDIYTLATPYAEDTLDDLYFLPQVDVIYIYHKTQPTKMLRRKSTGVTTEDWDLIDFEYVDGPYEDFNDEDTQLIIGKATNILKLERTAAFGSAVIGNYIEYKKKNQWYLGKVLGTASTPAAPADPTANVVYIEPVTSIVRDTATEAIFSYIPSGTLTGLSTTASADNEVRCTVKLLNTGLVDSWIRFKNTANNNAVVWCKILDYTGLIDYPTEILTNPTYTLLTIGQTYKLITYTSGSVTTDSASGHVVNTLGETFTLGSGYSVTSPNLKISNLSTKKQYDTVKTDSPVTFISVLDPVIETTHANSAPITTSAAIFDSGRDVGRFIRFTLGTKSVSCKITAVGSSTSATVKLLSSLPYKKNVDEILDNGITTIWRFGAIYTGNYPACGLVYENRHIIAGIPSLPDIAFSSESNKYNSYAPSDEDSEVQDSSAFKVPFEGDTLPQVTWLSNAIALLAGTASAVHQIRISQTAQSFNSKSSRPTRDSAVGSLLRPILVGTSLVVVERSGIQLKELSNNYEVDGFDASSANTVADHVLRQGGGVKKYAYQESPNRLLFFVHNDGTFSTMTYDKKEGVYAWAIHNMGGDGLVEDVSIVPNEAGTYDRVTLIVKRDDVRRREVLFEDYRNSTSNLFRAGMVYLDGATVFSVDDVNENVDGEFEIDGLDRYEGKTVGITIDGGCYSDQVVEDGKVTLAKEPASWAAIGYEYSSYLRPNRNIIELATGTSAGMAYKISELKLLLIDTCGMKIGAVGKDPVVQTFLFTNSITGAPPEFVTDYFPGNIDFDSSPSPLYDIISDKGYPLNILSITPTINLV